MITTIWKSIFSPVGFCGCLLGSLLLTGCGTTPPSTYVDSPGIAGTNAPRSLGSELNDPQVIKPGDTITIMYFDVPGGVPPQEVEIRPEGTVTLLLNQEFKAAGLTPMQLEKSIRDRYVPSFYRQMTVTVRPRTDTRFYYVGGEVRNPGRQIYLSKITVLKAIQSAGDFTDFGQRRKVQLTRSGATKPVIVNCVKALQDSTLDLEVFPGDKIHVPRKYW